METKKINNSNKSLPSVVDGKTSDTEISDVFAEQYRTFIIMILRYLIVFPTTCWTWKFLRYIRMAVTDTCCSNKCAKPLAVTSDLVGTAINKLKRRKSDGVLDTDHLINSCPELHIHLSLLYTAIIYHGFPISQLVQSTILPIPKNSRKSLSDSSNFRGIALNSPLGKLFELVLLHTHRESLVTSPLQFGYKKGLSTTACTFVADEVIEYYTRHHSSVHVMLLDASQAFDCVNYVVLFRELLSRGLCPLATRVLLYLHLLQRVKVRWGSELSEEFYVSNGVKQGGILSPILFTINSDLILKEISDSKIGCYLGNTFCGALAYADDIILMTPTRSSLAVMLDISRTCAEKLCLKFNGKKSNYLVFGPQWLKSASSSMRFCNVDVLRVDETLHLGNVIGSGWMQESVRIAVSNLNQRTNVLLSRFRFCHPEVKYRLFQSQCLTVYGSQLWDFDSTVVHKFFSCWRVNVRRVWGLPRTTHCHLLPAICQSHDFEAQLISRSLRFIRTAVHSPNSILRLCMQIAIRGSSSSVSNTISLIASKYHVSRRDLVLNANVHFLNHDFLGSVIRDLVISRYYNPGDVDLQELIADTCTLN